LCIGVGRHGENCVGGKDTMRLPGLYWMRTIEVQQSLVLNL
jgi:hypothetical protein